MNDLFLIDRFLVFLGVLYKLIIDMLPFIIMWSIFYGVDYFFGETMFWILIIVVFFWIIVSSYVTEWNKAKELLPTFKW